MTELDDELPDDVAELLAELGTNMVFNVPASKTHSSVTGAVTLGAITFHTVKIAPPVSVQNYGAADITRERRIKTTIAARDLEFTPDQGMTSTYGGYTWVVDVVYPIASGDSMAAYDLEFIR